MNDTDTINMIAAQRRDVSTELVPQSDARARFVSIDPERLGGVPCFVGTRVPIKYLQQSFSQIQVYTFGANGQ